MSLTDSVKETFRSFLEINTQKMIKGIRTSCDEQAFISKCIDEIREELKSTKIESKANALNKLSYLQMLGYNVTWCAFNIVEVMSSEKLHIKKVGYLASSLILHEGIDLLLLITNLLKKDLHNRNYLIANWALHGISCYCTSDMAQILFEDVMTVISSTANDVVRQRAILVLHKIFIKNPQSLKHAFTKLQNLLTDQKPSVKMASITLLVELVRHNPHNYLLLTPTLFNMLKDPLNCWIQIKLVKIFSFLVKVEPRLSKKLFDPMMYCLKSPQSMSLTFECINTLIATDLTNETLKFCLQKLAQLLQEHDPNLRYLSLLCMSHIPVQYNSILANFYQSITNCLNEHDQSIRLRALALICRLVDRNNLVLSVECLKTSIAQYKGAYCSRLVSSIINICKLNDYQNITNFNWYVATLIDLASSDNDENILDIVDQLLIVAVRVKSVREFIVNQMIILITNTLNNTHVLFGKNCQIISAVAWICSQYSEFVDDILNLIKMLGQVEKLCHYFGECPGFVQQSCVQAMTRLVVEVICRFGRSKILSIELCEWKQILLPFHQSQFMEVQERSCLLEELLEIVFDIELFTEEEIVDCWKPIFESELNPVSPQVQRKIPIPEGLDLDKCINKPLNEKSEKRILNKFTSFLFPENNEQVIQPEENFFTDIIETENNLKLSKPEDFLTNQDIPAADTLKKSKKTKKGKKTTNETVHNSFIQAPDISTMVDIPEGISLETSDNQPVAQNEYAFLDLDKISPEIKVKNSRKKRTKKSKVVESK